MVLWEKDKSRNSFKFYEEWVDSLLKLDEGRLVP